jgi:ribosome biogenesis GTPase / thiamine phosphate phosphatase
LNPFIQETSTMTHPANPTTGVFPVPFVPDDSLAPFGWTPALAQAFRALLPAQPGRVVASTRGLVLAQTPVGEHWATPSGRLRARLQAEGLSLCAGDWVALQPQPGGSKALIQDLLPRGPSLTRQESGPEGRRQWLASNIDVVLVLMGLDRDFNLARLERLLALAWGSGARPLILLTKADLQEEGQDRLAQVESRAPGVPVRVVSSLTGEGLAEVRACLPFGQTGVMVGSSGVGKSTLLNALAGAELRRTREVRASDGRGKHTTSLRELFRLPGGGCLIDTPGLREVGLSEASADLDQSFADLAQLASHCRFRDCAHGNEPGCAVRAALEEGDLETQRYQNYRRLAREVAFDAARGDERLWREREAKWRGISKQQKALRKK